MVKEFRGKEKGRVKFSFQVDILLFENFFKCMQPFNHPTGIHYIKNKNLIVAPFPFKPLHSNHALTQNLNYDVIEKKIQC